MSLEDDIQALTVQLKRNNDILEAGFKRAGAVTTAASAGRAPAPAPARAPAPAAARRPAAPTEDKIRVEVGAYLSVKDPSEKAARKENVKAMLRHFGVSLASEIPEESRAEALGYIEQFAAGETPNFMNEGGVEEDDVLG